ncbi:MAG: hypothetical protein MJE66_17580 [Proteobacteria bacterium]|nr:hypothetical protein [Pseudomonadota bacterium]
MTLPRRLATGLGVLLLLGAIAAPGWAGEVRRLEAVGAVGLRGDGSPTGPPRDAAIQAALREAVTRVATEFLIDVVPDENPDAEGDEEPTLEDVLGEDMVPYTTRFRILDDRGVRTALFSDEPGVSEEYVVVVEVAVDVSRVQTRLVEAGLIEGPETETVRVPLQVEGVELFGAYQALRDLLLGPVGARGVVPVEWERGRVALEVETDQASEILLARMLRASSDELDIQALAADEGPLRVRVRWTPPPPEEPSPVGTGFPSILGGGGTLRSN